ncbi:MAG: metallopeptidase family protein [Hyphomicrobiales bacterium]|nr:metallopeptidase family protein [Hyphomicrobiales bacterium]
MARTAYAALPAEFRRLTGEVIIGVAEFPENEVVEEMGLESPFDLMGLFQGIGLPQGGAIAETGRMPNRIWLYRRPILDWWAENGDSLGHVVTHVLVHEIGHHFGFSDDDMEAIEAAALDEE